MIKKYSLLVVASSIGTNLMAQSAQSTFFDQRYFGMTVLEIVLCSVAVVGIVYTAYRMAATEELSNSKKKRRKVKEEN